MHHSRGSREHQICYMDFLQKVHVTDLGGYNAAFEGPREDGEAVRVLVPRIGCRAICSAAVPADESIDLRHISRSYRKTKTVLKSEEFPDGFFCGGG